MLDNNNIYLIGETAFHHQGEVDYLYKLIDKAKELELSAIKFHLLFDVDDYFTEEHPAYNQISQWTFTPDQWFEVIKYAKNKNLDIITLCNDNDSLQWVNDLEFGLIDTIELHATAINDVFLLEKAAQFNGTVMLGVGGSSIDQMDFAIDFLRTNKKTDIFLMYGFQNYPTDYKDINLDKMIKIKELFNLPIGYADHTNPNDELNEMVSVSAVLKGINVLEKHFTLNTEEKRIDSQSAVSIDQMKKIKTLANVFHLVNGNGSLKMSEAELKYGDTGPMKKAVVAKKDIPKGKTIGREDLAFKRSTKSSYIEQSAFLSIIGSESTRDINKNELINFENTSYQFRIAEIDQFNYNEK